MPGFLDIPLELRNHIYSYLLAPDFAPRPRGVICLNERYIKSYFPPQCYRGSLRTCRQMYYELKAAIQHEADSNRLHYELTIEFNQGRPFYSLTWLKFPGLSPTMNWLILNVDMHLREPFGDQRRPSDADLDKLLEARGRANFARRLLDNHLVILLNTLSGLLHNGLMQESSLYIENLVINLKWPTQHVETTGPSLFAPWETEHETAFRRVRVGGTEAQELEEKMRNALGLVIKEFGTYDVPLEERAPASLVQIGCLRFATEGDVWATGNNLSLRNNKFGWSKYY